MASPIAVTVKPSQNARKGGARKTVRYLVNCTIPTKRTSLPKRLTALPVIGIYVQVAEACLHPDTRAMIAGESCHLSVIFSVRLRRRRRLMNRLDRALGIVLA